MKKSSFLFSIILLLSGAFSYGNNGKTELGSSNKEQLNCSKNQTATQVSVMNFRDDVPPVNSPLNRESVVSGSSVSNVSSKNKSPKWWSPVCYHWDWIARVTCQRYDGKILWSRTCRCDNIHFLVYEPCYWTNHLCVIDGGWLRR